MLTLCSLGSLTKIFKLDHKQRFSNWIINKGFQTKIFFSVAHLVFACCSQSGSMFSSLLDIDIFFKFSFFKYSIRTVAHLVFAWIINKDFQTKIFFQLLTLRSLIYLYLFIYLILTYFYDKKKVKNRCSPCVRMLFAVWEHVFKFTVLIFFFKFSFLSFQ